MAILSKLPGLADQRATVRVGDHWITFPAFDHFWSRYLWGQAAYERDVEQIFSKLGPGRVLIDCGANIGYWSVRAPDFGFERVIAVEANPDLMSFLRDNLRLNETEGTAVNAAIYSVSGEQLLLGGTDAHAQAGIASTGVPVTSITIADLAADIPADRPIVAKLDVEGAEIAALQGAEGRDNIVFIYEDFVRNGMKVTDYVLGQAMSVFGVAPSGLHRRIGSVEEAIAFNAETTKPGAPSNLVACAANLAAQVEEQLS